MFIEPLLDNMNIPFLIAKFEKNIHFSYSWEILLIPVGHCSL